MNPVIDVNTDGRCRRSKPRRKSGTGVVAARITLAATPIVPLIRMFHIAHRPSTDSDRPEHLDPLALGPTSGRNTREQRRTAPRSPGAWRRRPTVRPAICGEHHQHHHVDAERPERLAGRGDDGEHEQDLGQQLAFRPEPVDQAVAVNEERVRARHSRCGAGRGGAPPRHRASPPVALRRPTTTKSTRPMPKRDGDADDPGQPRGQTWSSTPFTP